MRGLGILCASDTQLAGNSGCHMRLLLSFNGATTKSLYYELLVCFVGLSNFKLALQVFSPSPSLSLEARPQLISEIN